MRVSAQLALVLFTKLAAAVVRQKANDPSMRSERGLTTILHCLQWYTRNMS